MRIIEEKQEEKKEVEVQCFACKTKFAYEPQDVKTDSIDRKFVECPKCKMQLFT